MFTKPLAIIPAGTPKIIDGVHPFELKVASNGRNLLENLIEEALEAGFRVATPVRGSEKISHVYRDHPDVAVVDAKSSLPRNVLAGLVNGAIKQFHGLDFNNKNLFGLKFDGSYASQKGFLKFLEKHPEFYELPLYCVASDCLATSEDFVHLRNRYTEFSFESDVFVDMTNMVKVRNMNSALRLRMQELDSTILNSISTKQGDVRINNMSVYKPFKLVERGLTRPAKFIYDGRQLAKGNVLGLFSLLFGISEMAYRAADKSAIASVGFECSLMRKHIRGEHRGMKLDLNALGKSFGDLLGLDVHFDSRGGVAPYLDVDDLDSYRLFRESHDRVMDYLSSTETHRNPNSNLVYLAECR